MNFRKHTLKSLVLVKVLLSLTSLTWAAGYSLEELEGMRAPTSGGYLQGVRPFKEMKEFNREDKGKEQCRYFTGRPGSCRYGSGCRYSHSAVEAAPRVGRGGFGNSNGSFSFRGRGRGSLDAGASRGRPKETPAAYAARKERNAQEKLERTQSYAKSLGVTVHSYMSGSDLEREIQTAKAAQKREKEEKERKAVAQEAEKLGVSAYASFKDQKAAIAKHKKEERERSHAAFLARRAKWSYGTSENRSGYRIGSASDPEAAKQIIKDLEDFRKSGGRPTYQECLKARHAAMTLGGSDAALSRHSDYN